MKTDNDPSIIFGYYCTTKKKQELFNNLKKNNIKFREIGFIDVQVPLNRKDEIINYFKHFVINKYWCGRNPFCSQRFIRKTFAKIVAYIIKKSTGAYIPVKYKYGDWENDIRNPLLFSLSVPLLIQDTSHGCSNEKEKKQFKELINFQSKNYKPNNKNMRKEEKEFNTEWVDHEEIL